MKIKTSELTGPALDYLVGRLENHTLIRNFPGWAYIPPKKRSYYKWRPSTDWRQSGPIIERELISISPQFINATVEHPHGQWAWQASCVSDDVKAFWVDGPTPLVAAMRCYVASKLGEEVDVTLKLSV